VTTFITPVPDTSKWILRESELGEEKAIAPEGLRVPIDSIMASRVLAARRGEVSSSGTRGTRGVDLRLTTQLALTTWIRTLDVLPP
jgi:hypothetical protein